MGETDLKNIKSFEWVWRPVLAAMVRVKLSQLKTWKLTLKSQKRARGGEGDEVSKAGERSGGKAEQWCRADFGGSEGVVEGCHAWNMVDTGEGHARSSQIGKAIVHTVSILSTKDHVPSSSQSGLNTSVIFLWIPPGSS